MPRRGRSCAWTSSAVKLSIENHAKNARSPSSTCRHTGHPACLQQVFELGFAGCVAAREGPLRRRPARSHLAALVCPRCLEGDSSPSPGRAGTDAGVVRREPRERHRRCGHALCGGFVVITFLERGTGPLSVSRRSHQRPQAQRKASLIAYRQGYRGVGSARGSAEAHGIAAGALRGAPNCSGRSRSLIYPTRAADHLVLGEVVPTPASS